MLGDTVQLVIFSVLACHETCMSPLFEQQAWHHDASSSPHAAYTDEVQEDYATVIGIEVIATEVSSLCYGPSPTKRTVHIDHLRLPCHTAKATRAEMSQSARAPSRRWGM